MAIDYLRKAKVLKNGLCKKISKIDKKTYLNCLEGIISDKELDNEYFDLVLNNDYKDIEEARKVNRSRYVRTTKLRNKIKNYLSLGKCLFLTLTFNESTLASNNDLTRKKRVREYLKRVSSHYVANIDYGGKNGREHYHALVVAEDVDYSLWHRYGAIKGERVVVNDKTITRLPLYITKLTNHAIKDTNKRCCLIYSR